MDLGPINKVTVVGGGTMGSGIAAHLANLGFSVTLLSLTRDEAMAGIERVRHASPPGFMTPQTAGLIQTGGIQTHHELLTEADWICEAIVEKPEPKRELYAMIDDLGCQAKILSTNTSGLPLADLAADRSESFRSRFIGTHFFNPPRYLKLLELIPGPDNSADYVRAVTDFLEDKAARRVVPGKDTPGFIANRFGMFVILNAMQLAEQLHFTPETVDAITGSLLGRPKSGTFRLADIIGLDVIRDIVANLKERCNADETWSKIKLPATFATLLEKNWTGDKVGQGFYRKQAKDLFTFDSGTNAYRQRAEADLPALAELNKMRFGERLVKGMERRDEIGEFLRLHLPALFKYAESIRAEVCHTAEDFDRVMEWGFGWHSGPFRLADLVGAESLKLQPKYYSGHKTLNSRGKMVNLPKQPQFAKFTDFPILKEYDAVTTRNLGDGIVGLGIATKMGIITPQVVDDLTAIISETPEGRYVLFGATQSFSVGYDLKFFLEHVDRKAYDEIDQGLVKLHHLGELLEKSRAVAALYGFSLGAGLEVAMSCPIVVADAEAKIGLPESKVGVIPGGRGTVLMRMRGSDSLQHLAHALSTLALGKTSSSAVEARELCYLRESDVISYHPDRIATMAIEAAKRVEPIASPTWSTPEGPIAGFLDRAIADAHKSPDWSPYDATIAEKLKLVFLLSKSYEDAAVRERMEFLDLCSKALTRARLAHMIEKNKPLRN